MGVTTSNDTPRWGQGSRLPAEVTSFVGRRREMAEVRRLLLSTRLVTLIGVGGVGKTRLAGRAAASVRKVFPDGVWLVELADLGNDDLLIPAVCESLRIPGRSARPGLSLLIDHLRDAQALLVLDNCEHLLDEVAALVGALLRSAPRVRVLATSRQPLGVEGEQTLPVPPLPLPGPDGGAARQEPAGRSTGSEAVQLFAERAEAVVPGFAVTDANRGEVERIVRRLDGLPLGIELAAVRLRALSVGQLLARLNDRFRLLTSGSRAVLPRHQTLRALIDWSFALCTDAERLLWARATVFSGGLDLEAAEEVCAGDGIASEDVLHLMVGLVEKSVLVREDHEGAVRYRLLETIRQYGRERLASSGEEPRIQRRHRDYYRDLVTRADQAWFSPEQVAWFRRLRLERGNIRAALDHCLATPGESEAGLVIMTGLRFYWLAAGFLHEGRRWLDPLLATGQVSPAVRTAGLCANARFAVLQSDFAAAVPMLDEARRLASRCGDTVMLGRTRHLAGLAALIREDLETAVTVLEEAMELQKGDRTTADGMVTSMTLGAAYSLLGRTEISSPLFEENRRMCEERGDHWYRSYMLTVYGIQVWREGDVARALEMERESIRLKQPFDDLLAITLSIEVLAWIAADGGDPERAARLLGALREMWGTVGGPPFGYMAAYREQCAAIARDRLGAARYEALVEEGGRFDTDQAIAYALGDRAAAPEAAALTWPSSPLTRREAEIARLVARGMTNKEIAATLVIARRTAEGHVEHILTKLGFNFRAQIAAWVAEQEQAGPDPPA